MAKVAHREVIRRIRVLVYIYVHGQVRGIYYEKGR